jgi:hypothetical protein
MQTQVLRQIFKNQWEIKVKGPKKCLWKVFLSKKGIFALFSQPQNT